MNEVIYNGITLNDIPGVIIKSINDSILPPLENTSQSIQNKRGSKFIKNKLKEKSIEIEIEINAKTQAEKDNIITQLAAALYTEDEKDLVLKGTKTYKAILDGDTKLQRIVNNRLGTLNFIAHDPVAYGQEITALIPGTVTNNGQYKTKGKIIINVTSNISYLKVTLVTTGHFIYIDHTFIDGDVVEIDCNAKYKVTKSGNLVTGMNIDDDVYLDSEFFAIPPGSHTIEVEPVQNGSIVFNERWLYV